MPGAIFVARASARAYTSWRALPARSTARYRGAGTRPRGGEDVTYRVAQLELPPQPGTVSPAVIRILSLIPSDFDAGNRGVWSIIRLDTAGSSDAISMPVDSASPHILRASPVSAI